MHRDMLTHQHHHRPSMTNFIARTAPFDATSGRTSIRLSGSEWEDLDRIADESSMKWAEWAAEAIAAYPHLKKVAAIRKALQEALSAERLNPFEPTDEAFDHAYVKQSQFFDDSDLEHLKSHLREVWAVDCGGYIVRFGFNSLNGPSDPLLLVESRMKDGVHMTFAASNGNDE